MKPQKLTVMLHSTRLHVPSSSNCFPNIRGIRKKKTKSHDYRRRKNRWLQYTISLFLGPDAPSDPKNK